MHIELFKIIFLPPFSPFPRTFCHCTLFILANNVRSESFEFCFAGIPVTAYILFKIIVHTNYCNQAKVNPRDLKLGTINTCIEIYQKLSENLT